MSPAAFYRWCDHHQTGSPEALEDRSSRPDRQEPDRRHGYAHPDKGRGRAGHDSFNIRDIGGNHMLIQIDGVRVSDSFSFGAQASGRDDYGELGLIQSVEILRSPLFGGDQG